MNTEEKLKSKEEDEDTRPSTPPQADLDQWAPLQDNLPRPFDIINNGLLALGALSIDDFLNNAPTSSSSAVSAVNFDINFHLQIPELAPVSPEKEKDGKSGKAGDDAEDAKNGKVLRNAVALLRQTCQSVFGSSEALNYEYLEEDPNNRQCILTITRPGGATRSYKSESGPLRRGDAKAQAAQVAIEMGALDFIVSGDSDALKAKKGLLLNPLEVDVDNLEMVDEKTPLKPISPLVKKEMEDEAAVKEIEQCLVEWRAGMVKPHWVYFNGYKDKKKHGAALKIALNAHVFRAYSVDPTYPNAKAAKIACSAAAIKEGVLDFIKHGNGQTEPVKLEDNGLEDMAVFVDTAAQNQTKGLTLQEYYETLPKPFPEDVGDVPASEINAPAWLNLTMQSARGARLASSFTPIVDSTRHLHGHILRIERPGETRTYLVDPQFPKRGDAKSAVCLLAMSQGVGDYIRNLKDEAENKLTPERRKLANEKVLQTLATECSKVRFGNRLNFIFTTERDAFGCTLKVDISPDADKPDVREYKATAEYRNKADAKAAVACIAAEQGLIDLLRFRGATPPPDYVPFWEAQVNGDGDTYVPKRKEPDREVSGDNQDRKKRRKGNNVYDNLSDRPISKIKLSEDHPLPPKPATSLPPNLTGTNAGVAGGPVGNNSSRWKKPHATGPRGLGPSPNAYAPVPRSGGQDRSGNRSGAVPHPPPPSGAHSHHGNGYSAMSSSSSYAGQRHDRHPPYPGHAPPPPPPHQPVPPNAYPYDDRADYRQGPSSYPHAPAYPPPDPYGNAYPSYPSAPQAPHEHSGHYPHTAYHSPPHPPPPPPAHHYPAHYPAPPPAPPTPPHTAYGHYAYSAQYPHHLPPPHQYPPHLGYPVPYPSHAPVIYSPPPPPPAAPVHVPVVPPSPPHYGPYSPRHRSHYDTLSPPPAHHSLPPKSPPHRTHGHSHYHSHHASYPSPSAPDEYPSSESHWQMNNNYRRHSSTGDPSRGRAASNNYRKRPPPPGLADSDRDRYMARPPSPSSSPPPPPPPPPPSDTRPYYEQSYPPSSYPPPPSNLSIQQPPLPYSEQQSNGHDVVAKKEPDVTSPIPALSAPQLEQFPSQSSQSQSSQSQSSPKTNVDILYDFCDKGGISRPTFYHKPVEDKDGNMTYMVWAEKDAQRLELQNQFASLEEGYEKLSKRVLQWERSRLAKK